MKIIDRFSKNCIVMRQVGLGPMVSFHRPWSSKFRYDKAALFLRSLLTLSKVFYTAFFSRAADGELELPQADSI